MRKRMKTRRLHGKKSQCLYWGADRAVAAAVFLAVTIVLLLIGFAGPSVDMRLPGPVGWLYIGVVIIAAAVAFAWLFCVDDKPKRGKPIRIKND
jgi:hypothetical protein